MTNYQKIHDDKFTNDPSYSLAEHSTGLRVVINATDQLSCMSGRSLDVGCGVGFVVEHLSGVNFELHPFGVDISSLSIEMARRRLKRYPGLQKRLLTVDTQELPFEDGFFGLVTCFDVLEYLDLRDIDKTIAEIARITRRGGLFLGTVSCSSPAMPVTYRNNLHRTIQSIDWWVDRIVPDRIEFDRHRAQMTFWKRKPGKMQRVAAEAQAIPDSSLETTSSNCAAHSSADLYQRIYNEHAWYGNADQGRCPGVRLLPKYQDWLLSPVIDLGCGRGQTVQQLRTAGLEADGVDQVELHPGMQVGDIALPIDGIDKYRSAICIDCIEHLHDNQVAGLFANMKRVERQAFSIHNGEATGTGQELHVNKRSFADWKASITEHFRIVEEIKVHDQQFLYLTESRV